MTETTFTAASRETTTARAVGAPAPGAPLAALEVQRRAIGPRDVRTDIKFCGICHSDIHFARGEWGEIPYPAVPSHEMARHRRRGGLGGDAFRTGRPRRWGLHGPLVPRVRELPGRQRAVLPPGDDADLRFDRPRWHDHPRRLLRPRDRRPGLRSQHPGGAGTRRRRPAPLRGHHDLLAAAPLERRSRQGVAVVGLGGLGHMAVKLAHAMGADVTVLSQSLRKQEDGLALGADAYYATSDDATFDALARRFHLLVNTVSAGIDIGGFLSRSRPTGRSSMSARRRSRCRSRPSR